MTTTIALSDAADGGIYSYHASSWATVMAGSNLAVTSASTITWGMGYNTAAFPGAYSADEAFLSFTYTAPGATEKIVASHVRVWNNQAYSTSVSRYLTWVEYDWGAGLTTADWRTPTQLSAATPLLANVGPNVEDAGSDWILAGSDALNTRLASAGPLRLVGASDRFRVGVTPTVDERSDMLSADYAGTDYDPRLVFTTVPVSTLQGVSGAQVQLSAGTHAYIEYDAAGGAPVLKYHDNTSASTIGTIGTGPGSGGAIQFQSTWTGLQSFALVVDGSDNLYVFGRRVGTDNTVCIEPWIKGGGWTWTVGTKREAALPAYTEGSLNNFAGAWHNVGTSGTIMLVASHSAGRAPQTSSDLVYALVNCDYLLTGTGTVLRGSGGAQGVVAESVTSPYASIMNETGTLLDVVAAPGTTDRGYVITPCGHATLSFNYPNAPWRYKLNSGGTAVADADSSTVDHYMVKDANAKARIVGIDGTVFAGITCDSDTGYGPTIQVMQNIGTSGSFSQIGYAELDGTIASLPAASFFATSPLWDVVYDSTGRKLWFYYFDTANSRRLLRTGFDMNTYLLDGVAVEVNATLSPVGATNYGLRVHRGETKGQKVLIAVASKTSGGVHSTIYQVDTFNVAPTEPTLTAKANFDATTDATFAWTFNDPNAGDTQSAYQLQINTSGGVLEYDSAKIASATPALINTGAAATGNNASVVPALPTGLLEGHTMLMLASIRNSGTGTVNTPTGWSVLATSGNMSLFGKVAGASESAPTVSFTGGVANADTIAQITAFSNLPLNVITSATQLNASAANVAYPALTITVNNAVLILAGWKQDDSTGYATVATYTEIGEANPTAGDDASQAWDYKLQAVAANITAGSFTVSGGASAISRGMSLALGPYNHTPTASTHTIPANTLTNAASWQWRVRTWDAAGLSGPWSSYQAFSTAAGGNVTITDPASDNPAGVITDDYDVDWSVSGTTQAAYRVKLIRTSSGATISDTGWVTSTDTHYTVTGMLTDVEYRVEVTVRNAGMVESGTGTRLITPDYGTPDEPVASLTVFEDAGYILVSVDNPTPTGDRPNVVVNHILRRIEGSDDEYVAIGTAEPDGTYRDYATASGVTYEYVVRGQTTA